MRVGGETRRVPTGTRLGALLPEEVDGALVVAGLLGQTPVSLATPILSPATVAPLTAAHWEGRQIYARSVGLLLLEAAGRLAPEMLVRMGPSRGLRQEVEVPAGADRADLARSIDAEMRRVVAANLPVRKELWTLEEAVSLFRERGWEDAALLLRTRRDHTVPLVTLGQVYALSPGPLLPSTSRIREFGLTAGPDGLLLDLGSVDPRGNGNGHGAAPSWNRHPGMVDEHLRWLAAMGVASVGAFNEPCIDGQVSQLIRVAEGFHEKRIGRIADAVTGAARPGARHRHRRPLLVGQDHLHQAARPSSCEINGLHPVAISLDDYYVDRERTAAGRTASTTSRPSRPSTWPCSATTCAASSPARRWRPPATTSDRAAASPEAAPQCALQPGDVLVLEGIHGLNPRLLGDAVGPGQLFRIFIHPATTLPFDRLSRVSATDLRLLRRIVRDRHGAVHRRRRQHPALAVGAARRAGAHLPVPGGGRRGLRLVAHLRAGRAQGLRRALPARGAAEHPAYPTAVRLRHLVDRFVSIYPDHVPPTSILREFIGGSGFEY